MKVSAGRFVGQLGKLRPIDNRPTALFAPGSGGNQPPRRLGGYHRQTHSAAYSGIGGYHRQAHWTIGLLTVVWVVTIARRIRPLTVVSTSIHQYPPVSTEAASLPHIAPVFATFMSHTPVRTLPCGRGSVPASLELFPKLD